MGVLKHTELQIALSTLTILYQIELPFATSKDYPQTTNIIIPYFLTILCKANKSAVIFWRPATSCGQVLMVLQRKKETGAQAPVS